MTLIEKIKEAGLSLSPEFNVDFIRGGDRLEEWFWGVEAKVGERLVQTAVFGSFRRGKTFYWSNLDGEKISAEEQAFINESRAKAAQKNRAAKEAHWVLVQAEVQGEWDRASDRGESPYFARKVIRGLFGCRLEASSYGARTFVPARDANGNLWGYQRIYSEKLSDLGTDKLFRAGARKEGCFHSVGHELPSGGDFPGPIYLCEGIATAISVALALGETEHCVVSCFDAGNLGYVARSLRSRYPKAHFVFAADDDRYPSSTGDPASHAGETKARQAVQEVGNAHVVLPLFASYDTKPTDFDDLRTLQGLEEVKRQLLAEPVEPEATITPVSSTNAAGAPKKPSEKQVCRAFLEYFGDRLVKQGRDLFIYSDGYCLWQDEMAKDRLKQLIGQLYGSTGAGIKDINNAFQYILVHAPTAPATVDLFVPPSLACNFQNGTLHLRPQPGGKPKLEFLPHSRTDFLATQIPFDFPGLDALTSPNPLFTDMLDRIFKGDPDKEAKIRVLAQMFGAVLLPCYPKIFFLVGRKGSGKSTLLKLLHRLVEKKNVSHVDPSHFIGFNLETMVGKLLNMVADIDLHKPMQDSIVKQITDRLPFRVSRKFQTDLYAPLPPIHIWGGNDLPQSLEGATGAYERRVVIVTFGTSADSFNAEKLGAGNYDLDFDEVVWQAGQGGILAFAVRGAIDLVESRGHYAVPDSSKKQLQEWDERSDILAQFLDALKHGEVDGNNQYKMGEGLEITRKNMWKCFASWWDNAMPNNHKWSEKRFCTAMRSKNFGEKVLHGVRFWLGIGMSVSPESET